MIHEHPYFMLFVAVLALGCTSLILRCIHDLFFVPDGCFVAVGYEHKQMSFTRFLLFYWRRALIVYGVMFLCVHRFLLP